MMDLPDCPPGAEGYEDSVVEVPVKRPSDSGDTKAEQEFHEHLNSLKINVEDGSTRPMAERRGRDFSGKWIYLCFPCAATCSGEYVLQTHISGKKHKNKLALKNVWPVSIFEEHPVILVEKGIKPDESQKTLQKMPDEVVLRNKSPEQHYDKYSKYKNVECHIQDTLDKIKAPLLGLEYLIEHPPEESHHEPTYMCTLCVKQGHPRTIVNHLTCYYHRYNFLKNHYRKAVNLTGKYRIGNQYREGMLLIMSRLAQRIEDKYGRRKPLHIDKDEYEREREEINKWIVKDFHYSENSGPTFEEVVDVDLIESLSKTGGGADGRKEPSPPVVAAPSVRFNNYSKPANRNVRRAPSTESLSDISGDDRSLRPSPKRAKQLDQRYRRNDLPTKFQSSQDTHGSWRSKYALKNSNNDNSEEKQKAPNHEYKLKLAEQQRQQILAANRKTLAYHEKNPEKHPLYPEEWKKFWNRRYKEIQAEGKEPAKHDFKPEWIVFWTARMKELHEEEMRVLISEVYRKLSLTPPRDLTCRSPDQKRVDRPDRMDRPERIDRRRSPERRRSPDSRRDGPGSNSSWRRSPDNRRRSPQKPRFPGPRQRSPARQRSPVKQRSPVRQRSPFRHRSPGIRNRSPGIRQRSPLPRVRTRSRSPFKFSRSPARTNIQLESLHQRSQSPLSRRESQMRNRSPERQIPKQSTNTVLISDDEAKPDGGLSPWNSDDDIESLGSLPDAKSPVLRPRSRTDSTFSRHTSRSRPAAYSRGPDPQDLGPNDNVVATLRLLVALEDYLGSLGPKIVDLLTEALKMEKEKANSSEDLLEREDSVALMETAKEKLKGAHQAGLVPPAAAAAVRTAIVRVASLLHEADTRIKKKQEKQKSAAGSAASSVPVAGVGEVNRAQIAKQMAAALIAQGKTDVSSEELEQLVDAVVGMAEAKQRAAAAPPPPACAVRPAPPAPAPAAAAAAAPPSASALQMLQSAYDEYDKKEIKDDTPDAMDGLSDSDLETLLKNFNELSAEEQHSLIAYLKKLEAREPKRVERLREYVTTAASTATAQPAVEVEKEPAKVVTVDSDDDDDYTVEEVFKSVKQKVKEDQIRQEMEIVTKSLLETKSAPAQTPASSLPGLDIIKGTSTANLLAIVQASIANKAPPAPARSEPNADVVTSNTQPRMFGDLPESSANPSSGILPAQTNQSSLLLSSSQIGGMGNQNIGRSGNISLNDRNPGNMPLSNVNMGNEPMNNINLENNPMNDRNVVNIKMNDRNMGNIPMDDRNMGNMAINNRNMGNEPMNNRNLVNVPMNNRNMGNEPMNNRNMGNMPMNDRNMAMNDNRNMGNMPMNNRNMGNMPINDINMANMPMNDRNMANMPMNDRNMANMPMNDRNMTNMPMNDRNMGMPMNEGNRGMNNRNNSQFDRNMGMNNRNMPMNNSNIRNVPMNDNNTRPNQVWDNRPPMQQDVSNQGQWESRPQQNNQDNQGMQRNQNFNNPPQQQYNQGPRNNFNNAGQQNRFNQQQQFGNKNFGGGGRGRGRGMRGRGRGNF